MPSRLPTGTVTFLFTDIEGSTRLLHELGERYVDVLAEHRRALREAFAAHGGVEVDTQGDAFFIAFARASDALAAAEAGQRALDGAQVRVRMGVHTGEPARTEEGYVGADVHLAARVMGAGHGGQVLVSEATARLVETELRDLGEHRLKDIERPLRLFQLGRGRFPPLKTLSNSHVPLAYTPLVGRKEVLADVLGLLRVERARLVTVTGPGGIGKTRFALEAAHELVEDFGHGVWFVDLSALRDPELVVPTIASTLSAEGELVEHVGDKELLVVLDNFEQVVEAATGVAELLARCTNVQLLVTSREPLHLRGERVYPLRPLAEAPAVELFRERAQAADPDFDAPWDTLSAIVERLDRLPLAVELAAARIRAIPSEELLARLQQRLPLLTSRTRDVPERQRTLRATIEWSYELLDGDEQRLFRALAVFAGGCTLAEAEEVLGGTLEGLESLVDKSLVRVDGGRFTMLQTVREYALEGLAQAGDAAPLHRRHAESVAQRGTAVSPVDRQPDVDNWRVAATWAVEEDPELAARLAVVAMRWSLTWGELLPTVRRALASADDRLSPELETELLTLDSWGSLLRGENEHAAAVAQRFHELAAAREDDAGQATSLAVLAALALDAGDLERAASLARQGLEPARRSRDEQVIATALHTLGEVERDRGDLDTARELLLQSLESRGDHGDAVFTLHGLGDLELEAGDRTAASGAYCRALERSLELDRRRTVAAALAGLAALAAAEGRGERAGRLWGASEALHADIGLALERPVMARYRRRLDALDGELFKRGARAGRELTVVEAAEYALADAD